ncbi:aminoglycoside 2'-N-acetyltransferase [Actinomadura craniellae]|uniref:Aminoglycoside 2'-N-acetyltransferase n=2 Tax=Actinomadura craniellae TaxID=2231787 RepID=A0A365GWW7_9ACTN|nr:GNAT family N-acetyltransferase [Actinomadura craniellae]RAY11306.1 aminoglycoside 2'-N-acetyltransferase [Actinomadura craniellae]
MVDIRTAHTAELDAATLGTARKLLHEVFEGDFGDHDWEHALGGVHALAWENAELIGHASVVQRRLLHGGRALRAGYVEAVAVRADRQGSGYGAALMDALERVVRNAYEVGALASSESAMGFYAARGWLPWRGPSSVLAPGGVERTEEDDDCIFVLPVAASLDTSGEIICDWRDGDVW